MNGIFLFVDHNGRFRISDGKPEKFSMRECVVCKTVETEDYHGHSYSEDYYLPGKTIQYWGVRPVYEPPEWRDNEPSRHYSHIPDYGTVIPKALVKEKYHDMTFDSEPVMIEFE